MSQGTIVSNWGNCEYTKQNSGPNMWTSNITVRITPALSETINQVWAIVTLSNGSTSQVNLSRTSGGGPGQLQVWQGTGFHSNEPATGKPRANIQFVTDGTEQNFA